MPNWTRRSSLQAFGEQKKRKDTIERSTGIAKHELDDFGPKNVISNQTLASNNPPSESVKQNFVSEKELTSNDEKIV